MHPYEPYTPPAPRRRRGLITLTAGIFGALLVAGIVIIAATSGGGAKQPAAPPKVTSAATSAAETSPPSYTPTKADFTLKVKITQKQCFGSAGCNVTFKVDLSYSGMPLDSDTTYDVTYKVIGPEDGALVNTLTVQGDQYSSEEDSVQTRSHGTRLHAVVTDVTAE